MNKRNFIHYGAYLVIAIITSLIYYKISQRININSDMASGFLAAIDVSKGNIFLKGWSLSTVPFYFTEIVWYSLVILVGGYHYMYNYALPAIYLVILCILIIVSCDNKKTGFFLTFFLLGSPGLFLASNILVPVIHIGAYIFSLISLLLSIKYIKDGSRNHLIANYFLLTMVFFSDSISLFIILFPFLVVCFVNFLRGETHKRWSTLTIMSLFSYASSLMIWTLFKKYGFNVPGYPSPTFVSLDTFYSNLNILVEGFLRLQDAFFFGTDPHNRHTIFICLSFLCLFYITVMLFLKLKKLKEFDNIDFYLCSATFVMPMAFVVSSVNVGVSSIRYIIPFFIFIIIFISRKNDAITSKTRLNSLVFSVMFITSVYSIYDMLNTPKAVNKMHSVSDIIKKNGLKKGYAEFWHASSISVYDDVQVAPVYYDGTKLIKMKWLSKDEWYDAGSNFVIINNIDIEATVVKQFGNPDKVIEAEGVKIFTWSKNLIALDN
ncbi:hypothetical protein [Lonsdalea quercina]|uniref:hypothetical protein n=1 Tax=Lonsdalea quercina TaxID=71657 RepID=UPI0039754452